MGQITSFDWEDLLLYVADRRVLPIVGRELVTVDEGGHREQLYEHLARRLAESLGISHETLGTRFGLNQVAGAYLEQGGERLKIYSRLRALVAGSTLPVPPALAQLAAITDLDLFVSTTFDDLLVQALDQVRFQGERRSAEAAFSPYLRLEDLPSEAELRDRPLVYRLFGRLSASADYAVTDEDVLEQLHSLQSESRRPQRLFDELRNRHLLFLGCGFPDWLARFFVRTLTNQRLLNARPTSEIVADEQATSHQPLIRFLRLYKTEVVIPGSPIDFVDELHRRWLERQPVMAPRTEDGTAPEPEPMATGAIFLSYAKENRPAVEQVKETLEEAGLDVWFDRDRLEAGSAWERTIRHNIRRCSLFLPLVSRQAEARVEGFFRKEWRWAIDRAEGMAESFPFIQPLMLDDTTFGSEGIPDYFWTRQLTSCPEGHPEGAFVERTRELIREIRERAAGFR